MNSPSNNNRGETISNNDGSYQATPQLEAGNHRQGGGGGRDSVYEFKPEYSREVLSEHDFSIIS